MSQASGVNEYMSQASGVNRHMSQTAAQKSPQQRDQTPITASSVILFDTCVWVDFFTNRYGTASDVAHIIDYIDSREAKLATSVMSAKDVFFLVQAYLKRLTPPDEQVRQAPARKHVAWACVKDIRQRSTIIGADVADIVEAECLRSIHDDLEDNLALAAAKRVQASILVTEDKQLQARAAVPSFGIKELAALIV